MLSLEPPSFRPVQVSVPPELDEQGKEVSPAKKIAVDHREIPKQCELHKMPADGACFFHAVAKGLHWLSGQKKTEYCHRQLRARVVAHLKKYTTEYLQEWDGLGPSLEKMRDGAATPLEAFERYLAAIAGESAYASELEARAISRIFNCCLCVTPQDGRFAPMLFRESQRSRSIILWYTSNHIDLLLPTGDAAYHDDLFSPSPGQAWKYKAGGKEGSVRSGTVWSGKTAKSLAHSRLSGTVWTRPSAKAKSSAKSRTAAAASGGAAPGSVRTVWSDKVCASCQGSLPQQPSLCACA